MATDFLFGPAGEDLPLVAEAIRMAESGPGTRPASALLYGILPEDEAAWLHGLAEVDEPGMAYGWPNFYCLRTPRGAPVAAAAAWVEDAEAPSALMQAQVLAYLAAHLVGAERQRAAAPALKLASAIALPRGAGQLQLENIAVWPEHRGRGALAALFEGIYAHFAGAAPAAEIHLMAANTPARRAYEKMGFAENETRLAGPEQAPALEALLGSAGMLRMTRAL